MLVGNLKHVKMMKEAGFDENQSKTLVSVWSNIVDLNLATKEDIGIFKKDLEILKIEFDYKFKNFESTLFAKFAAMQVATTVILWAWIKFIN